eukprot:10172395-Alexandrium_andersonii.AAC.1
MQQNRDKQEVVVAMFGRGAEAEKRRLFWREVPLEGRLLRDARVLGCRLTDANSTTSEVRKRVEEAKCAYGSMGAFWGRPG